MKRTIWYGAQNNQTTFAHSKQTLTDQGINNPQSFEVDGEVSGLSITGDSNEQQVGAQSGQSSVQA